MTTCMCFLVRNGRGSCVSMPLLCSSFARCLFEGACCSDHGLRLKAVSMQVIYQGTTARVLPSAHVRMQQKFRGAVPWHWTQTGNHWANEDTTRAFVRTIIDPYIQHTIKRLKLPASQRAIWLIDCWPVHISASFRSYMRENYPHILLLFVPPNCTGKLQPQDVVWQKPFKAGLTNAFRWYQIDKLEAAERADKPAGALSHLVNTVCAHSVLCSETGTEITTFNRSKPSSLHYLRCMQRLSRPH